MKIKFSKKAKKITIVFLSTTLIAAPIITASLISYNQFTDSNVLNFNNDNYNYVINNADKITTKTETTNSKWSIEESNSSSPTYFNSPAEMQKYITNKYVSEVNVKSSYDLANYTDPLTGILGNSINGDDIWKNISFEQNPQIKTVYRGSDGQMFENENEAKKSFEQIYEAYYFNDIYFNTKEELKKYLYDEYFTNSPVKYNAITIKAPNGVTSYSIKTEAPNFNDLVDSFVANNINSVIKYDRTIEANGTTQFDKSFYFTKENYKNNLSEINTKDLSGQRMYSNQGKSQYILDTSFQDQHTLYAPYFYEGTLDIGSFSNVNNWQKKSTNDLSFYKSGIVNDSIASVFNLLLNENNQQLFDFYSNNKNQIKLFEIPNLGIENEEIRLLNENYMPTIKKYNENLYNEISQNYLNLLNGKRYNSFYKIPVLYTFIMQKIITNNLPQTLLDLTVNYFSKICDHIQKIINSVILRKEFLVNINNANNVFDLKHFFNIGNSQYNLNSSIESYMELLKQNFPLLAIAFFVITIGSNDLSSYAGLISSYDFFMNNLKNFGLLNDKNSFLFDYHKSDFQKIYQVFTQKDLKSFSDMIIANNNFDAGVIDSKYFETVFCHSTKFYFGANGYSQKDLDNYVGDVYKPSSSVNNFRGMVGYNPRYNTRENNNDNNINSTYASSYSNDPLYIYWEYFKKQGDLIKNIVENSNYKIYDIYFLLMNDYKSNTKNLKLQKNATHLDAINKLDQYVQKTNLDFTTDYNGQSIKINKNISIFFTLVSSDPNLFMEYARKELLNQNNKDWQQIVDYTFQIAKLCTDFIPKVNKVLGPIIGVVESAFKLIDMIFIPKTKEYHYTYTTLNNDVFTWDGGSESRMFFNIAKVQETTNSSMKLIPPIEFVLPQYEEFFYYNQNKYFNVDNLVNVQMQTMIYELSQNKFNPPSKAFSFKYTFDKIPFDNNINEDPFTSDGKIQSFDSVDEVKKYVRKDIVDSLNSGNTPNSKYLNANTFAFNNGLNVQSDEAIKINLINNVLTNIRPTYISLEPNLDINGFSINNRKFFILPNKSWTSLNGLYENKEIDVANYIIDNSANELKKGTILPANDFILQSDYVTFSPIQAADSSKAKVTNILNDQINIQRKNVLPSEFIDKNNFNELNSEVYSQLLYKVKLTNQSIEYFVDVVSAQNWLSKNLNSNKIGDFIWHEKYVFNGLTFNSINELQEWVINNEKLINDMRGI